MTLSKLRVASSSFIHRGKFQFQQRSLSIVASTTHQKGPLLQMPQTQMYYNRDTNSKSNSSSNLASQTSRRSYNTSFKRATAILALGTTSLAVPSLAFTVGGNANASTFVSNTARRTHTHQGTATTTSLSMSTSATTSRNDHPLLNLSDSFQHSWIEQLTPETEENRNKSKRKSPQDDGTSNNVKRPVYNGHYVPVLPAALKNPRLVLHSPSIAQELNLSEEDISSDSFVKYFSGDVLGAFDHLPDDMVDDAKQTVKSWATPYALSIMGKRYTSNCPFGTGDGYGDGRAISVGEVSVEETGTSHKYAAARYELQLKGAGPTPFCRGADGRAVLRSSIREFLASEAMHFLGIETTRALSLVVSEGGDTSQRPWYSENNKKQIPDIDDPRLKQYSLEQRKQIIAQLNAQAKNDPDIMIEEPNAITCRVAPSFLRIGHVDHFARRATKNVREGERPDKSTPEFKELEDLVWHACFREFPKTAYEPFVDDKDILSASKALLNHSMEGVSDMVAGWVRVGFAQGNFNADNCLVAGRTMDYGPFGWMDEYHPLFAKWTGSGEHFGFMNQPNAGFANFAMLVSSVMPIIEAYSPSLEEANRYQDEIMEQGQSMFEEKLMEGLRSKLGFHPSDESGDVCWSELEMLMRENKSDWTVFWRQLTQVVKEFPVKEDGDAPVSTAYGDMFDVLNANDEVKAGSSPFYEPLDSEATRKMVDWIKAWREILVETHKPHGPSLRLSEDDSIVLEPYERMRISNPKYVLREWMLVEAYSKASPSSISNPLFPIALKSQKADESMVFELFDLIQNPYDEGTEDQDEKYYRRAPDSALKAGGTAFMS